MATSDKSSRSSRRKSSESAGFDKAGIKKWAKEWLDALLFAGIAALIIRTFIFEAYRIPTPSMENSLMTGDFLIVSKVHYGARTPMSIGIPFTDIHIPGLQLPWFRLPAIDKVERNDIVVFNYPIDDVVIAQKSNYIKRCVAIPGDTVSMVDATLFVNNAPAYHEATFRKFYRVQAKAQMRVSPSKIKTFGAELSGNLSQNDYLINMTDDQAASMKNWPEVQVVEPYVLPAGYNEFSRTPFQFGRGFASNHHQMAAFVVPFKGQKVTLTKENWHIYRDIVAKYEGNTVTVSSGGYIINGALTTEYTVKMDYYFMMGDNRDNSEDGRFWGFVPEDHVVGKPALVYFSWNSDPVGIRFERLFKFLL